MAPPPRLEIRAPAPRERRALYAWLNAGLRRGSWRRLEREFPTVAEKRSLAGHVLALQDERFAAHAVAHLADLRAGPHRLSVGMIGMVYTEPSRRKGGLARRCIEGAVEDIRRRGAGLCLLWSELEAFYRRLGFVRAGREWFFWLEREMIAAQVAAAGATARFAVTPPADNDWPAMEALYAGHPAGVLRAPGALRRLAQSPDCALCVARDDTGVRAYAARGRGDDFPDIVHEWAGPPNAVLACLAALAQGREWLGLLCPPTSRALLATLNAGGFRRFPNDLAWFRVVDAALLWAQLCRQAPALRALAVRGARDCIECRGVGGETRFGAVAFLDWILKGVEPASLAGVLPAEQRAAIRGALPVPLYLWGFDSV